MTTQSALSIVVPVDVEQKPAIRALLERAGADSAGNDLVPFGRLPGTHFGRLLILDESTDLRGAPLRPLLMLMADVDGPADAYLERLVEVSGSGLDRLFGGCEGYPSGGSGPAGRLAFLQAHRVKEGAFYANTVGRTVEQIQQEARLREAIEGFLDGARCHLADRGPNAVRNAIREFIANQPDAALGQAAGGPARHPGAAAREGAPAGGAAGAAAVHAARDHRRAAVRRAAAPPRDHRSGPTIRARSGAGRAAGRHRGPRGAEPVQRARLRQAGAVPAAAGERRPVRDELRRPPRLQPRRPGRRQDDPLRALGLPGRPAAGDLLLATTTAASRATWTTSSTRWRGG